MVSPPMDNELNKYWLLLTPIQKQSLLDVIKSFITPSESGDMELNEPGATYGKDDDSLSQTILQQLTWEQKEALINLVESFGLEIPGQRISIE
ncbi:MAG: hypothetical protein ABUT20_27195, partial [Bacteroidota bacterium]